MLLLLLPVWNGHSCPLPLTLTLMYGSLAHTPPSLPPPPCALHSPAPWCTKDAEREGVTRTRVTPSYSTHLTLVKASQMNADFSEFTFAYAVTDDLIHGHGMRITIAPVFPSLVEEGWSGGGYDLRLDRPGAPLFLQFKLSDRMVRGTASEAKEHLFTLPFYRMHLRARKHSIQHDLLLDLESHGEEVYYVAPAFDEKHELDAAYRAHQVWNRSFRLRPMEIGPLPTDDYHHIAFQYPGNWILRSPTEGKRGTSTSTEEIEKRLLRKISAPNAPTARSALESTDKNIRDVAASQKWTLTESEQEGLVGLEKDLRPLERAAYLARRFFDCQLFIASAR